MTVTIRASLLHPLRAILGDEGVDVGQLLQAQGIDPAVLDQADARLPMLPVVAVIEAAAEYCQLPALGLYMAESRYLDDIGDYFALARMAPSVMHALRDFCELCPLLSPSLAAMLERDEVNDRVRLCVEISLAEPGRLVQFTEYLLALVARMMMTISGQHVTPLAVSFRHSPPRHQLDYLRYFQAPVTFRHTVNCLEFNLTAASIPLAGKSRHLYRRKRYLLLRSRKESFDFAADVQNHIRLLILTGDCRLERLAGLYQTGVRSFQRRLAKDGAGFSERVDAVRRQLFAEMLHDSRLTLGVISLHLGFAHQSTLHKACLRWFGMTPSALRKSRRDAGPF